MKNEKIYKLAKTIAFLWEVVIQTSNILLFLYLFSLVENNYDIKTDTKLKYFITLFFLWLLFVYLIHVFFKQIESLKEIVDNFSLNIYNQNQFKNKWIKSLICTLLFSFLIIPIITLIPQYIGLYKSKNSFN